MVKFRYLSVVISGLVLFLSCFEGSTAQPRSSAAPSASGVLQWPMPGHDPQRTSRAGEGNPASPYRPLWFKNFNTDPVSKGFIPSKVSLVTVAGGTSSEDLILVSTSEGLYALRADDGAQAWFYPTDMPLGNAPTVSEGIAYVGCFDKTIHAVNIATGRKKWQTLKAGAGFDTSPLVINDAVYAGSRDGYFYAFSRSDGTWKWSFRTGGKVSFSAAASPDQKTIYFASGDGYAYALDPSNGKLTWKSKALHAKDGKFPGDGFYTFWPVATTDYVFFPGSQNYYRGTLTTMTTRELAPKGGDPAGSESDGWLDAKRILDYIALHPARRTFFAVNSATGQEAFLAPILWIGNTSGNRYPPAVGADGYLYSTNVWRFSGNWLKGRVSGWQVGTSKLKDAGIKHDSADENGAISIIGNKLFYNHKGAQAVSYVDLTTGTQAPLWSGRSGRRGKTTVFAGFDEGWDRRNYGDDYSESLNSSGTHGNVNPVVPIRDRMCFHTSGSVMCFGEGGMTSSPAQSRRRSTSRPDRPDSSRRRR